MVEVVPVSMVATQQSFTSAGAVFGSFHPLLEAACAPAGMHVQATGKAGNGKQDGNRIGMGTG